MKDSNYIALLDPSIKNNKGENSNNLGDLIIYDSIKEILKELFPKKQLIRISTHTEISKIEKNIIANSFLVFVGGSNLLTSDIRHFARLTPEKKKGFYIFPGFSNAILIGAGWCEYQKQPDWATKIYYNRILTHNFFQSVRDSYSKNHLVRSGIKKILNTCCPTTWKLNPGFINQFQNNLKTVLFTLHGYHKFPTNDSKVIEMILELDLGDVYFFAQSAIDFEYFSTLNIYKNNRSKFKIINYNYSEFVELINSTRLNYIGPRLHCGIRCLQMNNPTLILGFDNRSFEIKKDTQLNVIDRNNTNAIRDWIHGKMKTPFIELPLNNINAWKNQFNDLVAYN